MKSHASGFRVATFVAVVGLAILAVVAFLPRLIRRLKDQSGAWISVSELKDRLSRSASPVVIDVRGPEEFSGPLGHIPVAINLPLSELESRFSEVPEGRPIVLVCRTDKRSVSAAGILGGAGLRDVLILRGGMEEWQRGATAMQGPGVFRLGS